MLRGIVRLTICCLTVFAVSVSARAQSIAVTQANSNAEIRAYVEDVLLGSCVTVSNITFTGNYRTSGTFDGSGTVIGLDDGVILTTGRAITAQGPDNDDNAGSGNNGPGDADLTVIASAATEDATVLEFDFIPSNDTLRFNYIFASEEYPEYVNGGYNDAFGFFVSGPGIVGPFSSPGAFPGGSINVALIPGTTTPVTIDNVNNGQSANEPATGPCTNCAYFVDNSSGPATQYDGYTTVLTAEFVVVPCQTYHIKLAVADAGDDALDSGVFLEGGSFSAGGGVTVEIETSTLPPGIYEGCTDAWFVFRRVDGADNTNAITADFVITGTATPGVDYTTLPSSITIPAGQDSILVPISATLDFIAEGPESIIVTLMDPPCACEAPASATVNIVDNDIPLAITTTGATTICFGQSANLTADPSGSQTPYTSGWNNGAPAGDNVSVSPTSTTTYTYTVIDDCGGQTVTSSETITVIRPDFTVSDDEQCLDGNSFGFVNTGATGGSVTHVWDFGDSNSSNVENPTHSYVADGDYTVTHYIIFTASNCTADASAVVTVFSEPEITATVNQEVICDGGADGVISNSVSGGTSGFTYSWSPGGQTTSSITGQGVGTYTVTVTDVNGCTDSDSETIIQNDPVDPLAVCQNTVVQLNGSGDATISATDINNGSLDNCGIASLVVSPNAFTCSELGVNTVTLTVTDVNGNTDDCTATVTVADDIDPTAVCQNSTIYLDVTGNASITSVDVEAGSTDNCSVTFAATPLAFTCSDAGANSVTLTATDGSGNTDNCSATVTVIDTISPTITCPSDLVESTNGNSCVATLGGGQLGSPTVSDNCSVDYYENDHSSASYTVGFTTVTWTVYDIFGNSALCTQIIEVQDDVIPTAVCQDITIALDGNGDVSITSAQIDGGSYDNCAIAITVTTPNTFNCDDLGLNTVVLAVTDTFGNVSTCTATVTVEDNINPTAVCQTTTVQLDAAGNGSIVVADVDGGSSDNCSVTVTATPLTFDCSDIGANTVVLTATDPSSNSDDCNATVTVQDTISPTAICQDVTLSLSAVGTLIVLPTDIDDGSNDACGISGMFANPAAFNCADVGPNAVTLTVTDNNSNVSTCVATVTVVDDEDPTAICQNITVQLDANGDASITAVQVDNGSNDNCSVSLSATPLTFTCANAGSNTVTLTATDPTGNTDDCTATVTVQDTISPTAACQDITVQLDPSGALTILSADIDGGSSDNCGTVTFTIDGGNGSQSFACSDVGTAIVALTVTDANGNESTCDAFVTIEDNIDPTAACQDITIQLDANGDASISTLDIDNGSSDACGIASITLDGATSSLDFDCSNIGTTTVTLTVTDVNNNVSTCTADVTIEDTVDPTAVCQDITVQLDPSGVLTILSADIDGGSSDNCGAVTLTIDGGNGSQSFACSDVGTTTVTLTVTDANGNESTCDAAGTIEDNVDPTAACQDITVQLDASGNATITGASIDDGSVDICGIASLVAGPNSFDCSNIGANTVTLTVTDVNSNVSTCTADVTIEDTVDPTALCQDFTVQLDANGDATITASQVDDGSSDNCLIDNLSIDMNSFDCNNLGTNLVTLTVTDVNGNSSTCQSTVTVEDNVAPNPICQNVIAELDATGNVTVVTGDIDDGSTDNCAIQSITLSPNTFNCSNVGANSVTLTVTDVSGNVATCNAQVDVQDNVLPSAICQDITVQLDAAGNAIITPNLVNNGSSDACGSVTPTILSPASFNCSNVGSNIVTLTVEDQNGNISTCTSTVVIEDNVPPTPVCQNITVQLDGTGNVSIIPAQVDNGSSDNCAIDFMTVSPNSFTCAEEGPNTVVLTVTDVNGNSATCSATVTVENNVTPVVSCQDITVQLDATGNVSIIASDVDGGSNAACGIVSLTVDPSAFTCANVGPNTVTLTGTDNSGNTSTCTAIVTVLDTISPAAVCQSITVQLNATGNISIVAADIDDGSSDACGIASLAVDQDAFVCAEVGLNTVTLTVTDNNGNVSTCDATVTVQDTVSPIAICQNITVQLDANGELTIDAVDIDGGSTDACGIDSFTIGVGGNTTQDFACSNEGSNTVTLTVNDNNGNVSTCEAIVTVQDTVSPTAFCQSITVQLDANGNLTIDAVDIDGTSADACGIASFTINTGNASQDFTCAEVGSNTVTLTVTDNNGNVSTCDATVTVQDTISPNAICDNITVQLDANGELTITSADINGGSTDACGITSLEIDNGNTTQDFDCSSIGINTVTLTVTDNNGNSSTCDAIVTVQDTVSPVIVCQNITVQLDANGDASIVGVDLDGGTTDNCNTSAELSFTTDVSDFNCSNVGINTITLTATDTYGNSSTCTADVTIEDNVNPIADCQNITVQLDATGNISIIAADVDDGSSDACGIASLAVDQDAFVCAEIGPNTVTLTVTDNNGNSATCTATVTVQDTVSPIALCQNITVQLDATGNATISATDIDDGSTDNCAIASMVVSPNTFTCAEVGANTVTLTVTDVNTNVSTCDATVTLQDTISPAAVCQNITVQLDANGDLTITSADVDGGSTDNCGIASLEIDNGNTSQDFDCTTVGANTVTLTVTDVNGNESTCDAIVTVQDTISPAAICQAITVQLDANGDLTITSADVDGGSNDNCGIASLEIDNGNTSQDFDCTTVGANTVTLTVTDVNGNESTCDAIVTVQDTISPTAICQSITVQLDANGDLTITSADVDGGSTDNCGIASLEIDNGNTTQDFDCTTVGTNTVTLTVTDVNGNESTCDAIVTVQDTISPTAICQNITVQLDANGDLTITSADVDGGSTDNCGIASLEIDNGNTTQDFDCTTVGTNTVTLTVTDVNGNESTCDAIVTVEDTISPTIVCQAITIELDPSGTVILTAVELDGGTTDNCGTVTFDIDAADSQWTCADVGIQTVTLTATDTNGNTSTCDAQVTIEDNVVPTVSCQNITVYLDGTGNVSIDAEDVNGGSNASCGLASLTVSPNAFDCSNIGANTVTLTATDSTGNVTTCNAIVTVLDTISPTAVCNNITVDLDVNGDIIITAAELDGGSTDNCTVASVTVDSGQLNTNLDCSTVGSNTITLTVTDVNGNFSTCDATVTVEDNTNPTAACASVTVQIDANGESMITPVLVDNGSNDNCGIDSLSVLPASLDCNNIGANSIVLTVYDVNGNISTCVATVTAQDTISPTAVCTDVTVQLDPNGTATIAAGDIDDGSFDNCGIQSLVIDVNTFDCSTIGGNTVELTVIDVNGNASTCTANANVVDEVDPNVICQNLSVYLDASGLAIITAADIDNGSTDACGIDTMVLNVYEFDCSDIGVNPVTLTVTDNYGNFDICQAVVRVFDTISPVTVCQDITIQLDAAGAASIVAADVDGGSTDNCGIATLSIDQTIFDCTQVGPNTVTLTVVDVNGNQSTCQATVTVEDNVNPNANCQDITIYLNANGEASILASDINVGSNANCGVDTVFVNPNTFTCAEVGNNTVTLTVVDNNGNQSTCTANVEVLDTVAPIAICQDLTLQLDGSGQASTTATAVDNGSFDNCAIASLIIDQTDFDCSIVGANTVTLTVTDANGNVSTCTSQIAIEDTISPNATCTPVVVQLDANGTATITPTGVDLNSSDNCVIDTMMLDQDTFDCSEVGTNTVTLTVTDANGNSSTCTADIIVEENLPPVALCQDITVFLDTQGNASILPADVDAGSTDNCAIDTMFVTPNDFTCAGVGLNPVVLTVIDLNGNVGDCNAIVTVNDTISPIAICQDITVQLDSLGNASINAEEIDNGSSDACGITGFTVDVSTFDCSNVGTNTVVLTVADNNGNTSTCSATVTIEDNINPIANCLDLTVILDGNGTVNVSAGEFNDSSTDNCGIDSIFASQIDFSCADLGSNIITITVVDVNGNTADCTSELIVLDTLSPVIIACPLDSVIVPDSSDCSPQVFWTEPTAADNCTPTLTSDFVPGDNFPVGTTTVTYTAIDESNNSTTCSFDITIEPSTIVVNITSPEGPCGYNLSCSAFPSGEAIANVSGGCLPYDYVWTDGQTTQTAIGLAAGLYGVTVTDANGTTVIQTITLTEPEPLTTDSLVSPEYVGGANISCNGEFDGAVGINVLGGEECVTYDFVWTGPNGFTSTDEDLTGLEAGTYIVVVSDVGGCSYTDSITLVAPDALDVDSLLSDYNGVNISCGGAADGAIDLTISGGATPYSVSWNNGEMTEDIDSLEAGTYTYTVVDANGCEITDSITLTGPIGLTSSITTSNYNGVNISCFGLADGSIDLTINDGTQPFSYLWNNNETTEDIDSLQTGTYIVSIIDANGCTLQDSVTLVEPDDIVINSTDTTIISCNGVEDGAFTVQAIGGVPTFTYTWSDGQTGPTADNLGFGTYIVVATDINGCQDSIPLLLTEPAILDASVVQATDVICFGESNGIIDVNVLGGTFPYTYDWSNDSTTQDLNGVPVGVYSLEVTDANGCTDTLSVSLDEPNQLTLAIDTVIDATCSGAEDGEATVQASGGTAPYTYTWPNLNISGPTAGGLSAGVYEVQVVDGNGCLWSLNVAIGQPTSIEAQLDVQSDVSCNGLADGSALVTASGGSGPYTYLWSNSETDSLATGFAAGTHTVTVADAGGCDTTLTFVIDQPSVMVIDVDTLYNLTCNGVNNGQAEVDVAGGTSPYNVTWSNSDVGYVADNLGAGPHTAYVTDGNGCLDSLTVVITEPDTLEIIQVSTTDVACVGGDDGEATVIAQGGTAPLVYNWPLIGQTGNTATNLEASTYTFVVLDANGCTYTDTVQITEPEAIAVVVSSDTAVCPGSGVTISASASGGSGNYSYSWDNGLGLGASHFVSPSVPTTYSVEAFDQSGCSSGIFSVTVDIAQLPVAAFTSSANAPCILPTDVEFTNTGSGATGYEWFLGNGTLSSDENPTATYDNAGTYTVTLIASSGAGCSDTTTATVIIDNVPVAEFTLDNAEGCAPLVVNFGNNSTTGLQYSWDFGDGNTSTISNPVHVYEIPGEYEVTLVVTGDGGCADTVALGAAVSAYQSPIADFTPNNTSFPEPGNEYEFINNSNGADLYNWEFGNGLQTDDFQPTYDFPSYGGYFVTLTAINEFGCADTAVHYINVELFSSLHVPNAMAIGGIGESAIFIPKGTGIAEYHVWIFDNWGNQLWESTNLINGSPGEGWDGMYRGKVVPQGAYVWKINATFIDGEIWGGQDFSNGNRGNSGTVMVLH